MINLKERKNKELTKNIGVNQRLHNNLILNKDVTFKIAIQHKLDNDFDFKSLKREGLKKFQAFIYSIFKENMTISQVEKLFLRTKGEVFKNVTIKDEFVKEIHLGKNVSKFRLFGYFNQDNYFVITKIDPNHDFHKD